MATQQLTATFNDQVREALSRVASADEIATLETIMDYISRSRGKPWMFEYVARILARSVENDPQGRQ